jgi:DNA-directed RNA polymerase subunit RPC12/RpoP
VKLIDVHKQFQADEQCLDHIEKMRWPNGEIGCVHCGEIVRISKIEREKKGKNQCTRIYQCLACGKQFSATSGTIFNERASHSLRREFEEVIMVKVQIEEMFGSD